MARKKQTTRKSTRKEKAATKARAECPDCQWTTLLTTRENARSELIFHYFQFHGLAPVRQVEDSEDEAACQPTQQVHDPAPVRQVKDSEDAAQPIQKEVVTEQADTTQPAQHVPASQQGDKHEGVVIKEVVIKQVNTAQPTQQVNAQPVHQEKVGIKQVITAQQVN